MYIFLFIHPSMYLHLCQPIFNYFFIYTYILSISIYKLPLPSFDYSLNNWLILLGCQSIEILWYSVSEKYWPLWGRRTFSKLWLSKIIIKLNQSQLGSYERSSNMLLSTILEATEKTMKTYEKCGDRVIFSEQPWQHLIEFQHWNDTDGVRNIPGRSSTKFELDKEQYKCSHTKGIIQGSERPLVSNV